MLAERTDKLLEVSEVAARLRCSVDTIYRHRKQKDSVMKFVKVGPKMGLRVLESSVVLFIKSQCSM